MLFLFTTLFILVAGVVYPQYAVAQTPSPPAGTSITLSEISACQTDEWVEIYNSSSTAVDLTGWKIGKNVSGTVSLSGEIAPNAYKQIAFSPGFNNTSFAVKLIDTAGDTVETFPSEFKDDADKLEKCPTNTVDISWIKQGSSWALTTTLTQGQQNVLSAPPTPTPSPSPTPSPTSKPTSTPTPTANPTSTPQPTSSPTPGIQPTNIKLSEVYACQADGTKEWVELHNNEQVAVTLINWKLMDAENNEQLISSLQIPGKGFGVVEITKYNNGMLTNSGDTVKLVNGVGSTVDTMSYKACVPSTSVSLIGTEWIEGELSKGTQNSSSIEKTPAPTPLATETGEILGILTDSESETPSPKPDSQIQEAQTNKSTNYLAYGALGTGVSLLLGTSGYLAYDYKKTRKLKL